MEEKTHLQRVIEDYLKTNSRSARDLSLAVGPNDSLVKSILSGKSINPRRDTLEKLAVEMKKSIAELVGPEVIMDDDDLPPPNVVPAPDAPFLNTGAFPKNVEVRGLAVGGKDGQFIFNGQVIDYARRPPGIASLKDVAAIYVAGESMAPWRLPGDLVYFTDVRQARSGDHVIVEMLPKRPGEPGPAYLKTLVGRAGNKLRLAQYNPRDEMITVDFGSVLRIYRVFEWSELLGI